MPPMQLLNELSPLARDCVHQLRQWHAVGYVRSAAETAEWLASCGVAEPEVSLILTAFGF